MITPRISMEEIGLNLKRFKRVIKITIFKYSETYNTRWLILLRVVFAQAASVSLNNKIRRAKVNENEKSNKFKSRNVQVLNPIVNS